MHGEIVFVALFSIATAVALITRWFKFPYTVALVLAGLVLGTVHFIDPPHLTKELLYAVFLPGLIFEAALHLDFHKFWQNKLAIHTLAVPGVAVAILLTALVLLPLASVLHLAHSFSFKNALVFAGLIAATDPIAVVALFRELGAPQRLTVLIEAESLLNDGTAVVFFTLILGMVSGGNYSLGSAVLEFGRVVGLGIAVGLGIGFLASRLTKRVDDPMIEITLTTITAYGSFVLAEYFRGSGIIATVAAGMLFGSYGTARRNQALDSHRADLFLGVCSLCAQLGDLSAHRIRSPAGRAFSILADHPDCLPGSDRGPSSVSLFGLGLTAAHARGDTVVMERRAHLGWSARCPVDGAGSRAAGRVSVPRTLGQHDLWGRPPFDLDSGPDHGMGITSTRPGHSEVRAVRR